MKIRAVDMYVLKAIPAKGMLKKSVFVYPTETCYGLGCDALNPQLVERIYDIKGRDRSKLVSWIVKDIQMARRYAEFSPRAAALAKKFWPGPLTLVVRKKLSDGMQTLAFRASSHLIARQIVDTLRGPIVATSANISGSSECYSVYEVMDQLRNRSDELDFILDGGELLRKPPTTVVEVIGDTMRVLRQGEIVVGPSRLDAMRGAGEERKELYLAQYSDEHRSLQQSRAPNAKVLCG